MPYQTTPKMAQRKAQRRAKLLLAAIHVFGLHGFHAATVPMIVAAAESSVGSFYFYFRNKEDVYAAVLQELAQQLAAFLNQAIAAAGPDILHHMQAAVRGLVRFLAGHPKEARILIVESSGLGPRLEAIRRQIIGSHTRSVKMALDALGDRLPRMETAVVASCWVGAAYEAVFHWLEQPAEERIPAERLAETVVHFNLRGAGAPIAASHGG